MNTKFIISGILAAQIFLTGCSGILSSEQPAKQTYLLEPVALQTAITAADPLPELALSVSAVPGLDSDRIQALDGNAQLNRYANARWPDFLPEVLNSVIRRSLLSSGRFADITSDGSATDGWDLSLEIQQFYGVQSTRGSTARVTAEIDGLVNCQGDDLRLHLTASEPVGEERLSVVVKAHQEALDDVTRQLWNQLESHCDSRQ